MNNYPALRAGRTASAPTPHAPNAALLIDFDNVTLGVRSDLTKELRHLLDSDIIKGKVSVQRAYADWRRYPQYIVPLSESSIDLIFAPAFGTNKKNATDIRLAVDAVELVFTRPEIGTFILLSGDSDFSSLVLKLKEYGKYVIGVGIRESASDILIQNCDEYFSYSDLAGLTKESDLPSTQRDPWELVVEATTQMVRNRDVMRADRLKQVMQQIDPNFDERNAGFNRFSKFVQEAGTKGLIKVLKQENGQFEVAPLAGVIVASPRGAEPSDARVAGRPARGGRGRGKAVATPAIGDGRSEIGDQRKTVAPDLRTPAPATAGPEDKDKERRRRRRGGRGRGRGEDTAAVGTKEESRVVPRTDAGLTLAEAFHLLSRALGELPAPVAHETVRARMAALHGREDALLEPTRFPHLLRQANDAEVADVRMLDESHFEVSPHKADLALQLRPSSESSATDGAMLVTPTRPAAALRFRSGSINARRPAGIAMVGVVNMGGPAATVSEPAAAITPAIAGGELDAVTIDAPAKPGRRRGGRGGKATVAKKSPPKAAAAKVAKPAATPAKKVASPRRRTPKPKG